MVDKLFNVKDVAKMLHVSTRQVWRYVKSKKLKVITLSPKTLRFTEKNIEDFIKRHKK